MIAGRVSSSKGAGGLGALVAALCLATAFAADPILFPAPLHLTREVHDPVTGSTTRLDEYYQGNRVVSVRGPVTSIADYERSELTEIDRDRGTFSVSRFDEIARSLAVTAPAGDPRSSESTRSAGGESLQIRSGGMRQHAGRAADVIEVEEPPSPAAVPPGQQSMRASIALDREIVLSRDAFEVITGAAYPNRAGREHQMIAAAARDSSRLVVAAATAQRAESYRLPLEQAITYKLDNEELQLRSVVIKVDQEVPPPDLLVIPRGAQKVEGAWVQRARMLQQLETP